MFRNFPGTGRTPNQTARAVQPPVWRSYVDNTGFHEDNRTSIRAEQGRIAEVAHENRSIDSRNRQRDTLAAREAAKAARPDTYRSGIGTLQVKRGATGLTEDLDPESVLDDPVAGQHAAAALYKRDLTTAKDDVAMRQLKLQDPGDSRKLTRTQREEIEAEGGMLQETDPRHAELKKRLMEDDARNRDEQDAYQARVNFENIRRGGVPAWQERRKQQVPLQERKAAAQAASAALDEEDATAAAAEADASQRLAKGATAEEAATIQSQLSGAQAKRQEIATRREAPASEIAAVQAQAKQQADAARGIAPVAPRDRLSQAIQDAGLLPVFTDAATNAKNKDLTRSAGGQWEHPEVGGTIDKGPLDTALGTVRNVGSSVAGRLGSRSNRYSDLFKQVQEAGGYSDAEMQAAYSDFGNLNRKWEQGEKARVLSDGTLLPNAMDPDWLDSTKAAAIIDSTAASPASKEAVRRNLPQIQEAIAQQKAEAYQAAFKDRGSWFDQAAGAVEYLNPMTAGPKIAGKAFKPASFEEFAKQGDGSMVQKVQAYEAYLKSMGPLAKKVNEYATAWRAGQSKVGQTVLGLAGAAGIDSAGSAAASMAKESALMKQGAGVDGLVSATIEEAPSLAVQIALTRGVGAGASLLGASERGAQLAGSLTAFTTAGGQSAGMTYASELAQGTPESVAREKALKAGVTTALVTAAFGTGELGGVERVAAGKAVSDVTLRDLWKTLNLAGPKELVKSKALRDFAGSAIKAAGGEATEEGLDELLGAFAQADDKTKLADAWGNAMDAAAIGGFIGGVTHVGSGAIESPGGEAMGGSNGTPQAGGEGGSPPAESRTDTGTVDTVNAAITAGDPAVEAATAEEVGAAQDIVGPIEEVGADEVAAGVALEREISTAAAQADAELTRAALWLTVAQRSGQAEAVTAAEAEMQAAIKKTMDAPRARAVVKIGRGAGIDTLTSMELASMGITREGKPMAKAELEQAGLTKPLVELADDGTPILLDEAIKQVKGVVPAAAQRVAMTEAQARAKAKARVMAAENEENAPESKIEGKTEESPAPAPEAAPEAPATTTFTVTGKQGTTVQVQARSQPAAVQAGAEALPLGEQVESVNPVQQVPPTVTPEAQSPAPPEGQSEPPPEPTNPKDIAPAVRKRVALAKKRFKDIISVTDSPGVMAEATESQIYINPEVMASEAAAAGFDAERAAEWTEAAIDEELRHHAHLLAAYDQWEKAGKPATYEAWRAEHYGRMWREDFTPEQQAMAADIYGQTFEGLEDWAKAMEAIRMVSQQLATGTTTEVHKLWSNMAKAVKDAIRAALDALKRMSANLSPKLKAEVDALDKVLKELTAPRAKAKPETGKRLKFDQDGEEREGEVIAISTNGKPLVKMPDGKKVMVEPPVGDGETAPAPQPEQPSPFALAGEPLGDGWYRFNKDSGTKGIPRDEMPQIKAEDRSALVQFLRARGIDYVEGRKLPSKLKPSQAEFSAEKVEQARKSDGDRAILVAADGFLVDGHHQWLAEWFDNPNEPMRVITLKAPLSKLLPVVREFPSAQSAVEAKPAERIREDSPEAQPIIQRRNEIAALGEARWNEMQQGQVKDLTHPQDLLTPEEKEEFHQLGLKLRPKSAEEARADIMARRKKRLEEEQSPAEEPEVQPATPPVQGELIPAPPETVTTPPEPITEAPSTEETVTPPAPKPAKKRAPRRPKGPPLLDMLENYFKPGAKVKGYGGMDEVVSFQREGENWSVTVKAADGRDPDNRERTHSTAPDRKMLEKTWSEREGLKAARPGASDADYLDAVNRGDMATAQRMVDEAAKAAGYGYGPVWHGTPDGRFLKNDPVFRSEKQRNGWGRETMVQWFAASKKTAQTYADDRRAFDYQNSEPATIPAYLKITNPLVIDGKGQGWRTAQKGRTTSAVTEAMEGGYDGLIVRNVQDDYQSGPAGRTTPTDTFAVFTGPQIKSADPVTRDADGNVIPLSKRFDSSKDSILYASTPSDRDAEIRRYQEMQAEFADQGKVVGNPDRANPGATDEAREFIDAVDENRKFEATRETREQWNDEADRMLEEDRKAFEQKFLTAAYSPAEAQYLRPEDIVAAMKVASEKAAKAGNSIEAHAEAAVFVNGYRDLMRNQARTLAAGYDRYKSPEERHRTYLAKTIYTVDPSVADSIAKRTKTPAEFQAAMMKAATERLEKIATELGKQGVTLGEVLGESGFMSLAHKKVMGDVMKTLTEDERAAIRIIQSGGTASDVKRGSGLRPDQAQNLLDKVRGKLAEALGDKAKQVRSLADLMDGLKAAKPGTEEQMTMDDILFEGFGLPPNVPINRLPKSARSKAKGSSTTNWNRPEFEDGLKSYTFDPTDKVEVMKNLAALRMAVGAAGTIGKLEGKKKAEAMKALVEINKILRKYRTSAEQLATGGNSNYRFDISDRNHVMQIARTIQAIDADYIDKGVEWYYNAILSGIQTMTVNMLGVGHAVLDATLGRGAEAAINFVLQDPRAASLGEVKYMLKAMGPMLSRAWSNALAAWGTEAPYFEEDVLGKGPDLEKYLEGRGIYAGGSIGGKKGRVIRVPSRLLLATDEFVRTAIASSEVGAMAYRLARVKGLKPETPAFDAFMKKQVNIPGSEAWQMAAAKASDRTFTAALPGQKDVVTGESAPVRGIGDLAGLVPAGIQKVLSHDTGNPVAKLLQALLRVTFFPFQRVPFNILRAGLRRTLNPVSLFDIAALTAWNKIQFKDGRFAIVDRGLAPEIIERSSQQLQGAVLMMIMAGIAGEGDDDDIEKKLLITGSRPLKETSKGLRELGYRTVPPYTISWPGKDGKRQSFSYMRMEPMATQLATTVDLAREMQFWKAGKQTGKQSSEAFMNSLIAQATDKTFMRGFADIQKFSSGQGDISRFVAGRFASGVLPNLIRQPIRESDPYLREYPEGFMQRLVKELVPYGGEKKFDVYGKPIEKGGPDATRWIDIFDSQTIEKLNRYDEMLYRYKLGNPQDAYAPSSPTTDYEVKDEKGRKRRQPMNPKQAAMFKERAGQLTLQLLNRESFNLKKPTDADIKKFRNTVDTARDRVRKLLVNSSTFRNLK